MDKNFLLSSLQMLLTVSSLLKANTREQLNRTDLVSIKAYIAISREKMSEQMISSTYDANVALMNVAEVIGTTLADSSFKESDTDMKEFIVSNIERATMIMYKVCGVHYTTKDFDYSPSLPMILNRIIDECIKQGYYFGIEV